MQVRKEIHQNGTVRRRLLPTEKFCKVYLEKEKIIHGKFHCITLVASDVVI
jgi:hypothetical protein